MLPRENQIIAYYGKKRAGGHNSFRIVALFFGEMGFQESGLLSQVAITGGNAFHDALSFGISHILRGCQDFLGALAPMLGGIWIGHETPPVPPRRLLDRWWHQQVNSAIFSAW